MFFEVEATTLYPWLAVLHMSYEYYVEIRVLFIDAIGKNKKENWLKVSVSFRRSIA